MFNNYEELLKEEARIRQQEEDEIRENPLMQYSTSQLKAELRRRKKERCREEIDYWRKKSREHKKFTESGHCDIYKAKQRDQETRR